MKRLLALSAILASFVPLTTAYAQNMYCQTGQNNVGVACNFANTTETCPGGPHCVYSITVKGKAVTITTLNGWASINKNVDGSVTATDCDANWATFTYQAGHAVNQPAWFRACSPGEHWGTTGSTEPSGVHVKCGAQSSLGQNNSYYNRHPADDFPCNSFDKGQGAMDTDECAAFNVLRDFKPPTPINCLYDVQTAYGPFYFFPAIDPQDTPTCSGS